MRFNKWTEIERDGCEIEINVEFDATPFVPATFMQPAEGGEIEILAVFVDGIALDPPLTDDEETVIIDYLYESLDDSDFDDEPDWDAVRDARIDDELTKKQDQT